MYVVGSTTPWSANPWGKFSFSQIYVQSFLPMVPEMFRRQKKCQSTVSCVPFNACSFFTFFKSSFDLFYLESRRNVPPSKEVPDTVHKLHRLLTLFLTWRVLEMFHHLNKCQKPVYKLQTSWPFNAFSDIIWKVLFKFHVSKKFQSTVHNSLYLSMHVLCPTLFTWRVLGMLIAPPTQKKCQTPMHIPQCLSILFSISHHFT